MSDFTDTIIERRAFLGAAAAIAHLPLVGGMSRTVVDEIRSVTLRYRADYDELDVQELQGKRGTFNSMPLCGVPAGELLCVCSEASGRWSGNGNECWWEIKLIYERPRAQEPILRSATFVNDNIEYESDPVCQRCFSI